MSPAYPPTAVKPPAWPPRTFTGTGGLTYRTESPLLQFRTWAAHARVHLSLYEPGYVDGYAAGWRIHGDPR